MAIPHATVGGSLLTRPAPPRRPPGSASTRPRRRPRRRGHLVVSGLAFSAAGGAALDSVSFEAVPGSTSHLIGSSVGDTSSLLGLLLGLYRPAVGTIVLDGADLTKLPLTATRSSLALVLCDPWIMNGTIVDNITFGDPVVDQDRVADVAALTCVDELAAHWPDGMDTIVGDGGVELSAGEQRLIALARALLRNPDVLLVEDPMRDLTAREETAAMKALNRAIAGRTAIIATPKTGRLHTDAFGIDQTLILDDGRLHHLDSAA